MSIAKFKPSALAFICSSVALISACTDKVENSEKPNIIFILADDLGYNDLACYGQEFIKTPNIDRLAEEGIRFTHHYSGSTVSAPSRCVLMTGLHTGHAFIKGNYALEEEGNLPLPPGTLTVAGILQNEGYITGLIGKWGLGGPYDHGHPNKKGFDYSFAYLDQKLAHNYYPEYLWRNHEKVYLNNYGSIKKEYSHDLFTEEALQFININKDKPFFLYLPYTIPHGKYEVPDNSPYTDMPWPERDKNYAAMITRMDNHIGKILELLNKLSLDEKTIVFFASDNGPGKGVARFFESNKPFRGYKNDLYEGGIRVPLIVRWTGKINAAETCDHISAFWDFLPTVCDLINVPPPDNTDGISYLPSLLGKEQDKHEFLYWENFAYNYNWTPGSSDPRNHLATQAVRMGDWKAVISYNKNGKIVSGELFDLNTDPGEQNDLAASNSDILDRIKEIMKISHEDTEFFKAFDNLNK